MWLQSTGVQIEKRETKPKKGKQSPGRVLFKRILDHAKNYIHLLKNYCSEFSYWNSWLTILIEKGGFYNAGISFNHLQLLAGWVQGCFRARFNRLQDQTAWYIEWRSRASFEVQDKEKWTLAPLSVKWQNRLFRQQRFGCLLAPLKFTAACACSPSLDSRK